MLLTGSGNVITSREANASRLAVWAGEDYNNRKNHHDKDGDEVEKWMEAAYRQYYQKMIGVAYRKTGDRSIADDLVQEVFVQAVSQMEELAEHPNFEAWLMLTLRNVIGKERRRVHGVPLEEVEWLLQDEMPESVENLLPCRLAEEDRRIILWRYRDQVSCREIADRLGVSEVACRSRISRALQRCKRLLNMKPKERSSKIGK